MKTQKGRTPLSRIASLRPEGSSSKSYNQYWSFDNVNFNSAQEPTKLTKSAIRKAHKLARIERKRRQKLEAREKAKHDGPEAGMSPDQGTDGSSDETTPAEKETETSLFSEPVPAVVPVPTEVTTERTRDRSATPMVLNGPPHPPLTPEPFFKEKPSIETESAPAAETKQEVKSETLPKFSDPAAVALQAEKAKKRQNILTRTLWSLVMIGGFIGMFPFILLTSKFKSFLSPIVARSCVHGSAGHTLPIVGV